MKLCKDCRYLRGGVYCHAPQNGVSLVDGEFKSAFATINRSDNDRCAERGDWWKPWPTVEIKPWWKFWK